VSRLESEESALFSELKRRAEQGSLKEQSAEINRIQNRRASLATKKTMTRASLKETHSLASFTSESAKDERLWYLLVAASTIVGVSETGDDIFKHNTTGKLFTYKESRGGNFLPEKSECVM
jgi:hypothetical protein